MSRHAGFSLVELMLACLLGLLIVAALAQLFLAASRGYRAREATAQLHEELRFALAQLAADLELAGDAGEAPHPERWILEPAVTGGGCGDWIFDRRSALATLGEAHGGAAHTVFPCVAADELHEGPAGAGTDLLALWRVSPRSTAPAARITGRVYLDSDGARSVLYRQAEGRPAPAPGTRSREWQPVLWYLRRWSVSPAESPRVPALCRKVLNAALRLQSDPGGCVASGIDDLRLEFGVDTGGDGIADFYAHWTQPPPAALARVVAVRVHLLARSAEPDPGWLDTRTWRLGAARRGPYQDHFRRHAATVVTPLRNPAWRMAPLPPGP